MFKGAVSPDIASYFIVCKFKSVLSVRRLMVFTFVYFVVLPIHISYNCFNKNIY
jgi:hypothetical protein